MRFYKDWPEATNELRRELKEMGVKIVTRSVQNKVGEFPTLELQNYCYTVLDPQPDDIPLKCPEWAQAEFNDRVSGEFINPGHTWKMRAELWGPLLNKDNRFDYWYPERMAVSLEPAIMALHQDLYTRRAFIPIFSIEDDKVDNLHQRVPCTIGYWLNYRQDKLNMTYLLRSSDFSEHYNYDVWLATKLLQYIAEKINVKSGTFTHWIGSFHVFENQVEGVF